MAEKLYLKPQSVEEAVRLATENKSSFRFLAGGTDVVVNKYQGNENSDCLIDISGIKELKKIITAENELKIGALITLEEIEKQKVVTERFPALSQAAHAAASPMLRKTATIGGNILCENRCSFYNQSAWWREAVGYCLKCDGQICIATGGKKNCFSRFVSDMAPVLISMEAKIEAVDQEGHRTFPLENLYTGDGVNSLSLPKTALIKYIVLQTNQNLKTVFKKLRPREAVDFTSLTTAVTVSSSGKMRIVIGGVDPKPVIVEGNINGLNEEYIKQALRHSRVVDNDYYTRKYRREMISVFLEQSFKELTKINNT